MSDIVEIKPERETDLAIARILDAPRDKLFRCWTEPDLIKQWFAPKPWGVSRVETDVRPGGSSLIVMRGPDGTEFDNRGVYLDVVRNERLVFTDAFTKAWEPSARPFFVGVLTFQDAGQGRTTYTAIARHWTKEARDEHDKMGFHQGWGICADQLEALAQTL